MLGHAFCSNGAQTRPNMKYPILSALVVGLLSCCAATAQAQVTTYFSAADFDPATVDVTTGSFSFSSGSGYIGHTYTSGPLTFSSTGNLGANNDGQFGSGVSYLSSGGDPDSDFTISLTGATALSFTLATPLGPNAIVATVNGVQVATFNVPAGAPTTVFFGVTDTVPITSVTLTETNFDTIDAISFQTGSAAPEPSTWAMLAAGAGLLGAGVLRRQRAAGRA